MSVMLDGNVQHAPLDPEDDLVNEWTVVAIGPHHAALLSSRDLHDNRPDHEWTVVAIGPHHAALLSSRDLHDNRPDHERTFDFVQTYERSAVTQAAHAIHRRYPSSNS